MPTRISAFVMFFPSVRVDRDDTNRPGDRGIFADMAGQTFYPENTGSKLARGLPVNNAVSAEELHAFVRVLMKFDGGAVGILGPHLPAMIRAQFGFRGFDAVPDEDGAQRRDVVGFEANMANLRRAGGFFVPVKDFDELRVRNAKVKAKKRAVFEETKLNFESKRTGVKGFGAGEIGGENTGVSEGFDHVGVQPLGCLATN
jgi:hypothetical protein